MSMMPTPPPDTELQQHQDAILRHIDQLHAETKREMNARISQMEKNFVTREDLARYVTLDALDEKLMRFKRETVREMSAQLQAMFKDAAGELIQEAIKTYIESDEARKVLGAELRKAIEPYVRIFRWITRIVLYVLPIMGAINILLNWKGG